MKTVLDCTVLLGSTALICFVAEQTSSFIHEIGHLMGGLLAGYRKGFIKLGCLKFTFGGTKQRMTLGKGYEWQCVMSPFERGGKAGLLAHILGGVVLQAVLGAIGVIPLISYIAEFARSTGAEPQTFFDGAFDFRLAAVAYFGILGLMMLGGVAINLFGSESCDGATAREVLFTKSGEECIRRIFEISVMADSAEDITGRFENGYFAVSEPDSILAGELCEIGGRLGVV